jgi:alkylated DNA repair dioxygenase AlkB
LVVASRSETSWQPALFSAGDPGVDPSFAGIERVQLDADSWIDHLPGWLGGSDVIFDTLVRTVDWEHLDRPMFGQMVRQPRLTARWSGRPEVPVLVDMAECLSERYGIEFDSVGLNFYRDGQDSVAWHGDRIPKSIVDPIVGLVSMGEPRRFLLRPKGGGASIPFDLGRGDLLVTGGSCQRSWQHSVPKVRAGGARISVAYRHSVNRPNPSSLQSSGLQPSSSGPSSSGSSSLRSSSLRPSSLRPSSWRPSDPYS